jgi:hypothetical protein
VKTLATQTAKATEEIRGQIAAVQSENRRGRRGHPVDLHDDTAGR